jgi:hypothetical protein
MEAVQAPACNQTMRSKTTKAAACLIIGLVLSSCEAVKNRYDLWFVVPKNPFPPTEYGEGK